MIANEEGLSYAAKLLLILLAQSSFSWAKQKLQGQENIREETSELEQ